MKRVDFDIKKDGFYGAYWKCKKESDVALIAMLGDDAKDFMARTAVKWLHKLNVNVLTMSPSKKDYSHHNYPLERIEMAVHYLKVHGNNKIGIVGASTTGTLALTAASYFKDITLTIALTPSDFIWQGFMQGNKDGCKEWPVENESLFSLHGRPLPYMKFCYQHPTYWNVMQEEAKKTGNALASRKIFDDSEMKYPLTEEEMIKVENINGELLLIGAEDDTLWNTVKYINRMEERLSNKEHKCNVEVATYKHGTHFVFPQSMLKMFLPIGSNFFIKLFFADAKKYPQECLNTRKDIDLRVRKLINKWQND